MAVTAMAQAAPDVLGADSFAEIGAPERERERIMAERAAEAASGAIIDRGLESLKPTEFRYGSRLNMEQGGSVLEQVLNHPERLADIASDPEKLAKLEQDLDNVERTQNVLDRVLGGTLQLGDMGRTQLREISLELGNLHQVPRTLVHTMRLWTMNERNGGADLIIDGDHAPRIPSLEDATHDLEIHKTEREQGIAVATYDQNRIDKVLTEGPQTPKFEPELEALINTPTAEQKFLM